MLVRICDKKVNRKKEEILTDIRLVECERVTTEMPTNEKDLIADYAYVILYIDPETRRASVQEMYLINPRNH